MALRTLLVSHDEFVEAAFQDAVRGVGAELEVSRDSKSALLAVEQTRFDVVLIVPLVPPFPIDARFYWQ